MPARAKIFLVDDHPLVREWLANLLRQQADLAVAGEAAAAPAALAAMIAAPPDLAIVDLTLKNSSGLDLIKDLGRHLPETRVIVLSMHDEVFYAERALRAGARGYVTKQEATDRIVEAVRTVLAGRLFANPELLAQLTARLLGPAAAGTPGSVELLSDRELEVFRRLGKGQTTRHIAGEMQLSMKTVQAYCARIKEKWRLADAAELVREAVRWVEQQRL
ncbi:MAG: response regulator transcription factor [Opitutae bacterium]|nr:response regulator transcription factor [Opitutae bacterium]